MFCAKIEEGAPENIEIEVALVDDPPRQPVLAGRNASSYAMRSNLSTMIPTS